MACSARSYKHECEDAFSIHCCVSGLRLRGPTWQTAAKRGPTLFVPRSHLSGRTPQPGETSWHGIKPRSALVNKGDCVMFRSDVWHCGSPSTTNAGTRRVMQVHYCSSSIGHPTLPRAVPATLPEILAKANSRQRRLLAGFAPVSSQPS